MAELYGRKLAYSDVEEVTVDNVVAVIDKAKKIHAENVAAINYLYDMYRGKQDIRNRVKQIRSDVNNKICENRAYQIVTFETGYLIGKAITYITPNGDETEAVQTLNSYMAQENKATEDQHLVMWQKICGTSFRSVFPKAANDPDEAPFELATVDPTQAFVVYSTKIGNKPLCGVYTYKNSEKKDVYSVYTPTRYFEIIGREVVRDESNVLGLIPIIEYPANEARLGSVEVVAPLLNELNTLDSNRIDSIEQFVQALLVFTNCQLPEGETATSIAQKGIITLTSPEGMKADLKMIAETLDQSQTQILKEDLYQSILEIVGMPSVSNGNTSDSSNNGAVILKNGWQNAEAKAEACENMFKKSERAMLRVVLRICRDLSAIGKITLSDLQIYFPRQNYGDLQSKAQVLSTLLNNDKVHPKVAYEASNMFKDVEKAYSMGMRWYKEEADAIAESLRDDEGEDEGAV